MFEMLGKKKKDLPGSPIGEPTSKRWMVVLALGSHGDDAIKMATDGIAPDTVVVSHKDDDRLKNSKETMKAISSLASDLLDEMEKFVIDEKNRNVPVVIDLHVCGPMNACALLGIMIEKVRHQMFNDYDVMVKVGKISCYDRTASSKIEIDYQEV